MIPEEFMVDLSSDTTDRAVVIRLSERDLISIAGYMGFLEICGAISEDARNRAGSLKEKLDTAIATNRMNGR